ncbi:Uncharacterized protein Fot_03536 [Forsythia ovata]|uniref:Uncharacterized protein n=1 Tax=Forsythia ovata TaxID=205694 RepID=A0ABD1XAH6_9LAMI
MLYSQGRNLQQQRRKIYPQLQLCPMCQENEIKEYLLREHIDSVQNFVPHAIRAYFFDLFAAKINFTKPKKNPTSAPTPKMVQTKISLKAKSPPPAKGVVIKEPSPNSERPAQEKVSGKG